MNLSSLFLFLPEKISKALICLDVTDVTEIRLRANAPASVTCKDGNVIFNEYGKRTTAEKGIFLTKDEIEKTVGLLCRQSRYSFDEYINEGFIPLENGCRAGVCGRAIRKGDGFTFAEISSVSIRLSSFFPLLAKDVALLMQKGPAGVLIFSPPGVGKTTYLKSLIHLLSLGTFTPPYRICVIDERFELGEGITKTGLCDFIYGMPKSRSIELLTRTMSPEIIVCDEIQPKDCTAIMQGCNAGASFICSAHGKSLDDLRLRGFDSGLFSLFDYAVGIERLEGKYSYNIKSVI